MKELINKLLGCWVCSCGCSGCGRGKHCGRAGDGCVWDDSRVWGQS